MPDGINSVKAVFEECTAVIGIGSCNCCRCKMKKAEIQKEQPSGLSNQLSSGAEDFLGLGPVIEQVAQIQPLTSG